eukprot:g2951.t1
MKGKSVKELSVKELKKLITSAGLSYSTCINKKDLREQATKAIALLKKSKTNRKKRNRGRKAAEEMIANLISMGFPSSRACEAASRFASPTDAINWLLNNNDECEVDAIEIEESDDSFTTEFILEKKTEPTRKSPKKCLLSQRRPKPISSARPLKKPRYLKTQTFASSSSKENRSRHMKKQTPVPSPSTETLWSIRYAPTSVSDLAVHKKKVMIVREWLSRPSSNCRLLIISGPTGVGKSTLVHVLASELNTSLHEFVNSTSSLNDFNIFINRSTKYSQLRFTSSSSSGGRGKGGGSNSKQILLLDALPYLRLDDSSLEEFRSIISRFLSTKGSRAILIFSESSMFRRPESLLGKTLVQDVRVQHLEINPVSKTSLKKALRRIYSKFQSESKISVGPLTSTSLESAVNSAHGDLRHAINSLQFHFLGNENDKKSFSSCKTFQKKSARSQKLKSSKLSSSRPPSFFQESTVLCSRNEFPDLFRSVGRILSSKREIKDSEIGIMPPPPLSNRKFEVINLNPVDLNLPKLSFNPEQTVADSGIDPITFAAFIHQNSMHRFTDVCEVANMLDLFSFADMLCESRWKNPTKQTTVFPSQYLESLASRSLACANRNPAKKRFLAIRTPALFSIRRIQEDNLKMLQMFLPKQSGPTEFIPYISKIAASSNLKFSQHQRSIIRSANSYTDIYSTKQIGENGIGSWKSGDYNCNSSSSYKYTFLNRSHNGDHDNGIGVEKEGEGENSEEIEDDEDEDDWWKTSK